MIDKAKIKEEIDKLFLEGKNSTSVCFYLIQKEKKHSKKPI